MDMPAPVPPAVQSKAVPAIQALHSSLLTGTVPPMPGRTALPPIPPLSGTACLPTVGMAPEPSMFMAATPMTPMTPMGPVGLQSMPGPHTEPYLFKKHINIYGWSEVVLDFKLQ